MSKQVEIGQQFQSAGKVTITWEVVKIVNQGGIAHARLLSTDGNGDVRLMACSVLLDHGRYRMVREAAGAPLHRD